MPIPTVTQQLTLDIEHQGTTTIVRCHGKFVGDVLYASVKQVIPGSKRIILDLTDISYMDSMGLGTLMRLYVSARASGCSLELINIGKRVRQLLELTNILAVFAAAGEHSMRF